MHITSGFAGLAKALALGKRKGFADHGKEWKPHNLSNVFLGTAMLWFGWFGFNGGSALAGTSRAAMAASGTASEPQMVICNTSFLFCFSNINCCCNWRSNVDSFRLSPRSKTVSSWVLLRSSGRFSSHNPWVGFRRPLGSHRDRVFGRSSLQSGLSFETRFGV